jgi:hypothetical protein
MKPEDVAALIAWPHANICSDGSLAGRHPRGTGAFTRVLRVHVREQRLLTLEQAIHKMTGLSAAHVGLADRGVIRPGAFADLVLFDPETVADRSTFEHPELLSVGIHTVWVNGQAVFGEGKATGALPGRALRRANALPRAVTADDFRSLKSPADLVLSRSVAANPRALPAQRRSPGRRGGQPAGISTWPHGAGKNSTPVQVGRGRSSNDCQAPVRTGRAPTARSC